VHDWIRLIKHREPEAKILVVATHGGPGQRQGDLDRVETVSLFGSETVLGFHHIDSKPDGAGERRGIEVLKQEIARVAASLPEMGRQVPKKWQAARAALKQSGAAYLPLERVLEICREAGIEGEDAAFFLRMSHRLGHLIHYDNDPALRDLVILRPDWLAKAISFILDDPQTRDAHGLVTLSRLGHLWSDPSRDPSEQYPSELHPVFVRLMERFDISYKVADLQAEARGGHTSLIAQLVPGNRPAEFEREWPSDPAPGNRVQVQICRIVEKKSGSSAPAEGLFYQMIVRLHRMSLGRDNFERSVHWQRGLLVDDGYNGRALLEQIGNDIRITVRAAYPQTLLGAVVNEITYLIESLWPGLKCDVMVPCLDPCGLKTPGFGLFEVAKLIESRQANREEYPCRAPNCPSWQNIDSLLTNAPAACATDGEVTPEALVALRQEVVALRSQLNVQHKESIGRFDHLDAGQKETLSVVESLFTGLLSALNDEAREGPRLFTVEPLDPGFLNNPKWISTRLRLTLWCEHSLRPLPLLNPKGDTSGVYELEIPREWLVKSAPILKLICTTLSIAVPVVGAGMKAALDEATRKTMDAWIDLTEKTFEGVFKLGERLDDLTVDHGAPDGTTSSGPWPQDRTEADLRRLHAWLREKDPGYGGLVRVYKRNEVFWVHRQFAGLY
jgi:hypothetical protein